MNRNQLQDRFNLFVRLRDSQIFDFLYFECVSCPIGRAVKPFCEMNAGHFHHYSVSGFLTLDEVNVNGQCFFCNMNMNSDPGIRQRYEVSLIKRYGSGVIKYLDQNKKKRMTFDQATMIEKDLYYKEQIKLLNSGQYNKTRPKF